jgi:hypothetical protein
MNFLKNTALTAIALCLTTGLQAKPEITLPKISAPTSIQIGVNNHSNHTVSFTYKLELSGDCFYYTCSPYNSPISHTVVLPPRNNNSFTAPLDSKFSEKFTHSGNIISGHWIISNIKVDSKTIDAPTGKNCMIQDDTDPRPSILALKETAAFFKMPEVQLDISSDGTLSITSAADIMDHADTIANGNATAYGSCIFRNLTLFPAK